MHAQISSQPVGLEPPRSLKRLKRVTATIDSPCKHAPKRLCGAGYDGGGRRVRLYPLPIPREGAYISSSIAIVDTLSFAESSDARRIEDVGISW